MMTVCYGLNKFTVQRMELWQINITIRGLRDFVFYVYLDWRSGKLALIWKAFNSLYSLFILKIFMNKDA